jgi:hypothetical protein
MPNVLDSSASSCATSRTTGSPSGTPLLMNAEIRGAGNDGPVSTAIASSFLNAAGTMGG